MRILFSIILNASILFAITYLLGPSSNGNVDAGITLWCLDCSYTSLDALKTYIIGGIILGVINITVKPILKILSLPLFFVFFGLVSFVINGVVLYLLTYILNFILQIPGVGYQIHGNINFVIAVAIFTILNTLYGLIFLKK